MAFDFNNALSLSGKLNTVLAKAPTLSPTQQAELNSVMELWRAESKNNLVYDWNVTRNSYAVDGNPFNDSGRVRLSCDTLCLMVWGGIVPASFVGKSGSWNGTLTKAFDWGYNFQFPNRRFAKVVRSNKKPFGFHQPDPDSNVGSYSYNSYYDESVALTSDNPYQQAFRGFMSGSDMAQELFVMGCEVPLSEAQVGDIVFFKASRLDDNKSDAAEAGAFRNISHLGLIYDTSHLDEGSLGFLECTDVFGETAPVQRVRKWTTSDGNSYNMRAANLENRIIMVARHPAAFGIANPVPDRFERLPDGNGN